MREIKIEIVMTIIWDRLYCDLQELHETLEFILERPIMTHQIPKAMVIAKILLEAQNNLKYWTNGNYENVLNNLKQVYPVINVKSITDMLFY